MAPNKRTATRPPWPQMLTVKMRRPGRPKGKRSTKPEMAKIPVRMLDAFSYLYRSGLQSARDSMDGSIDRERGRLIRLAMRVASKVRDTAVSAEAAELGTPWRELLEAWGEAPEKMDPPDDPFDGARWIVAVCVRVVATLRARGLSNQKHRDAVANALHFIHDAIAVEPLEARVEAAKALREGKAIAKEETGPEPQAVQARPSLRLIPMSARGE